MQAYGCYRGGEDAALGKWPDCYANFHAEVEELATICRREGKGI